MNRSEVNASLVWAKELLEKNNFRLPEYAYWSMDQWRAAAGKIDVIRKVMLGWDITDFGMGDFSKIGAVLYTVRNGLLADPTVGVPYCEKFIMQKDGQRLPNHYHVFKTEDIINRAGGDLQVFLWNADRKTGAMLDTDVHVEIDGIEHVFKPGEEVIIKKGSSISLTPYVAHIFGPKPGTGDIVVGEVSKVNDDNTDNFFLEEVARFADIVEDEPIVHPLCNEYDKLQA